MTSSQPGAPRRRRFASSNGSVARGGAWPSWWRSASSAVVTSFPGTTCSRWRPTTDATRSRRIPSRPGWPVDFDEMATVDRVLPWRRHSAPPDEELAPLLALFRETNPRAPTSLITRAYTVAKDAHEGQARKSGEPYI